MTGVIIFDVRKRRRGCQRRRAAHEDELDPQAIDKPVMRRFKPLRNASQ
jgi:hypothetical protein